MQPAKLGLIISKYRKKNGLSVRQFAAKCGLSKAYISLLENGRAGSDHPPSPSLTAVLSIAEAMEMDSNELFKKLGLSLDPVNPAMKSSSSSEIKPFEYIEPTIENINLAVQEGRLLILPFRLPRIQDLVYVPMYAQDGMVVSHIVTEISGGVYKAYSEYSGTIEFNLYDINRVVFMTRKAAGNALNEWKKAHSDNRGVFTGPSSSMFSKDID